MTRPGSDRGAVLIHVAAALVGLFLFSGFVIDYGTFWVARNQVQNAADAGALAGATARLYDDTTSPPTLSATDGKVYDSVMNAVSANPIWGGHAPANTVNLSYTCPDATSNCVAVDVYRDGTHNSTALPTFFLRLVSLDSQGTKAHAVAQAVSANGTGCLRPWFLVDPGFVTPRDYGRTVQLHENLAAGGYEQLDVGSGGNAIRDAITQCSNIGSTNAFSIGSSVDTKPGGTQGPEAQGVDQLFQWDPDATVTGTGLDAKVTGGCAESTNGCVCAGNPSNMCPNGPRVSPRMAVVALCNGSQANCAVGGRSGGPITITNFLAFFVTACNGDISLPLACKQNGGDLEIDATLISTAGLSLAGGGAPATGESFLKIISLIR